MAHNHPPLVWDLETSGIYIDMNLVKYMPQNFTCTFHPPNYPHAHTPTHSPHTPHTKPSLDTHLQATAKSEQRK